MTAMTAQNPLGSAAAPAVITLESLARTLIAYGRPGRTVVGIAGAPGSGKSTFAERLETRLNESEPGSAAILPMDGYHYDDRILIARALRPRKGAPETFDVGGLLAMLARLRRNEEDEIAVPIFDRELEIARAAARTIARSVRYLLVEGNYLLLNERPWSQLREMFDATVAIDVPEDILRRRLVERWRGYGLSPEDIEAKVEGNDLPNGRYVLARNALADFIVRA
jgi:pantothenate kinase